MALEALQALRPLPRPALRLADLLRAFPGPDVLKRKLETFCFPPRDLPGILKSFDLSQSKKEPPVAGIQTLFDFSGRIIKELSGVSGFIWIIPQTRGARVVVQFDFQNK